VLDEVLVKSGFI